MKSLRLRSLPLLFAMACVPAAHGAVTTYSDAAGVLIPDGSSSGLGRLITVPASAESVVSIEVSLQIDAAPSAFLGDLYVYLSNGTDSAILLNRAGRTTSAPAGYGDNQNLNVTFSASGASDIHNYRTAVTGSETIPLSSVLNGIWQPDGRLTDPALVLDTSPRTNLLNVFDGDNAAGNWTLFVADLSTGGQHELVSWSITLTTVPEPSALLLGLGALPLAFRRRRGVK